MIPGIVIMIGIDRLVECGLRQGRGREQGRVDPRSGQELGSRFEIRDARFGF